MHCIFDDNDNWEQAKQKERNAEMREWKDKTWDRDEIRDDGGWTSDYFLLQREPDSGGISLRIHPMGNGMPERVTWRTGMATRDTDTMFWHICLDFSWNNTPNPFWWNAFVIRSDKLEDRQESGWIEGAKEGGKNNDVAQKYDGEKSNQAETLRCFFLDGKNWRNLQA